MDDWKSLDPRPLPHRRTPSSRRRPWTAILLLGASGFLAWTTWSSTGSSSPAPGPGPGPTPSGSEAPFSWDEIYPSPLLDYQDCGDGFQCARLQVPMDYNRTEAGDRTFSLAIVRIPAKVPVSDARYGGAVLINPGGPGGSGTLSALLSGRNLQTIVDAENDPYKAAFDENDRYFDIIGFDPRGVGATTPAVMCFPDPTSQKEWELQLEAEGMLGSCPNALQRNWQRTQALNQGCSVFDMNAGAGAANGDDPMLSYLNTRLVAQDLVTIIERQGEWREKQGQKAQVTHDNCHGVDESRAILRRTQWRVDKEPLLYWGRSYGTVLGATFAALFPNRVSRALLDGVVDMDKYYEGRGPNVIADADAIFDKFGQYCDVAGPDGCPFYVDGGPEVIKDAYWTLENQILNNSIPVMASRTHGPEVVTWTDLKAILRVSMGDPEPMAVFKHSKHVETCPSKACKIAGPWSPECSLGQDNTLYASAAILCSDASYMTLHDRESFEELWTQLKSDSATLGDYWAQLQMACVGWQAKAKYKFTGPWGGVTAHPILFVSNKLDPVTPLRSAQHMSKQFPGSAVLEQNSEGHTTIAAPSLCVARAIRNYFQTGALPDAGTICEADLKPLVGAPDGIHSLGRDLSPGDRKLLDASLAEAMRGHFPHISFDWNMS
ncbi:Peptidase S33 tripeptidyl aminopeptidase-like C-terminal [Penicillium cosmopolitanum]|uniref:Peptidase S33 tripeptidyl aminopeptidase-like C-terminal n=1 Tax=Penicillium cosmopolitanum TaxID=1131564 RepID=A0A9W9VPG8_9EURO|nr:Peptidase S33 tripeptidyl aminopeptidase-like C-terminal [Penicillium cosmopolitanum]KAJ5386859.1 Peptidase S33 tripeptidyl aminopeptidase-like C-terminal [Penicillium cosmopolitanum]